MFRLRGRDFNIEKYRGRNFFESRIGEKIV